MDARRWSSSPIFIHPFDVPSRPERQSYGSWLYLRWWRWCVFVNLTYRIPALANATSGVGVAELLTILLVQLPTPDEWIGFATGILGLCRTMGGSVGTAVYASVFQSKVTTLLPARVAAVALPAGLPATSLPEFLGILTGVVTGVPITQVPGVTLEIIEASSVAAREAYLESFRWVWLISIAFGIVAFFYACATKDVRTILIRCNPYLSLFESSIRYEQRS